MVVMGGGGMMRATTSTVRCVVAVVVVSRWQIGIQRENHETQTLTIPNKGGNKYKQTKQPPPLPI